MYHNTRKSISFFSPLSYCFKNKEAQSFKPPPLLNLSWGQSEIYSSDKLTFTLILKDDMKIYLQMGKYFMPTIIFYLFLIKTKIGLKFFLNFILFVEKNHFLKMFSK